MKRIVKIFGLILVTGLVFTSCGSDDDPPKGVLTSKPKSYIYTIPLEGIKDKISGDLSKDKPYVINLSEIIGDEEAKNFVSAHDLDRGKTYIKIEGLSAVSDDVVLKDFKIKVGGGREVNLGNCSPTVITANYFESEKEHSSDKFTNVVLDIFRDLRSGKKANIWVSFTPTETIVLETYPVYLKIKFESTYFYNVYPK